MFEHNLYPIFFAIITDKILFTLRAFLLLSSSNDASADIVMMLVLLSWFFKAEFTSLLYVHITLAKDTEAEALCFAQLLQSSQNILKLLAFKCFLNEVLLETEYSEVMLIW